MSSHDFRLLFLVAVLLLAGGAPAHAHWRTGSVSCRVGDAQYPAAYAAGSPLWADFWDLGRFFSGGGRARIVQVCIVAMCIALFIMMRKLNG